MIMRQFSPCSICLLLLFLFTQGCAGVHAPAVPKTEAFTLPEIKQDCTICHGSHLKDKGMPLLKKPLAELCIECHSERMGPPTEHKVGTIPSMNTGTLPLADNKLACITCHDPHSNRYGRMLRVPAQDLCQSCHRI